MHEPIKRIAIFGMGKMTNHGEAIRSNLLAALVITAATVFISITLHIILKRWTPRIIGLSLTPIKNDDRLWNTMRV